MLSAAPSVRAHPAKHRHPGLQDEDAKTIPGTLTWTRSGPGEYTLTSNLTPFTLNKTQLFINNGLTAGTASMIKWIRTSTSVIDIKTINLAGVNADDLLTAGSIEIRVYS